MVTLIGEGICVRIVATIHGALIRSDRKGQSSAHHSHTDYGIYGFADVALASSEWPCFVIGEDGQLREQHGLTSQPQSLRVGNVHLTFISIWPLETLLAVDSNAHDTSTRLLAAPNSSSPFQLELTKLVSLAVDHRLTALPPTLQPPLPFHCSYNTLFDMLLPPRPRVQLMHRCS